MYNAEGTVLVTRNLTESDEIRRNSARILQSFCAAIRGIAVLLPHRVSPISANPLTIPQTPLHDSADILGDAAEKLQISDADNPRIL